MDKFMDSPWFLRLTALALALSLFFSVRADEEKKSLANVGDSMDIIRDVPVEVYYDNENLVVTGVPETVNMTISGPTNLVQTTKLLKDFTLKVDLRSMPMGSHTVQIQSENISDKIKVKLDPATIDVDIEEKITQSFRVDPEMNDKLLADDYELVKMEVDPSTIEVTGAKSVVDSISFVKVSVTGDNEINKSFEQKGRVRVLDRDLNKLNVLIEPEEVTVKVDVEAYHKEVPISVKQKGKTKEGITVNSLTSDEKMVTLYGPRKTVDAIDQLNVDVDVSELTGSGKQSIELPKPKGVVKMSVDKVNVNIDVKVSPEAEKDSADGDKSDDEAKVPSSGESSNSDVATEQPSTDGQEPTTVTKKTRKFTGIEIGIHGLDKSFKGRMVKPSDGVAAVTVTGEEKVIDALTESDVTVFAEAKSVNHVGDHVLPIFVQVPSNVQYEVNFKDITLMVEQA
ncbi:CdaR family protein [Sporosarcina aquimarina]|uniref:CdaR family protein n=1 Tax=Sporosarcina aquimarina TaxID=114975 RepID=UPI00203E8513|nr:CdaR family protein [Sporosarcina aquimarina]MCM3757729.1 CdaR family protein [Sporosarcina aquimarina]